MKTIQIEIEKIEPNVGQIQGLPANPRTIDKEKFEKLKNDIKQYPELLEMRAIIVIPNNDKYVIIGGNMRFRALQSLGYTTAPCVVVPRGTSADKLRAYTILDNAPFGQWDWDMLANEWDEQELEVWALDFPHFDEEEKEEKPKKYILSFNMNEQDYDYAVSRLEKIGGDKNKTLLKLLANDNI